MDAQVKRYKQCSMVGILIMVINIPLYSAELENTSTIKDLGVIFDPELSFSQHCKEKINKVYAMLGIIKRNFMYLSEEAFVSLYKTLVRSHLE